MNSILNILCLSFALFCAVESMKLTRAYYSDPYITSDPGKFNEIFEKLNGTLDKKCQDQFKSGVMDYVKEIQKRMTKGKFMTDMMDAVTRNDTTKMAELQTQSQCCVTWGIVDNSVKFVKGCDSKVVDEMNKEIQQGVKQMEQATCTKYKYHSTECTDITGTPPHGVNVNIPLIPTNLDFGGLFKEYPVNEKCQGEIETAANSTIKKIKENVAREKLMEKITEAAKNATNNQDILVDLTTHVRCCSMWGVMDTMVTIVKQCNSTVESQWNKELEPFVKEQENSTCSVYERNSDKCGDILSDPSHKNGASTIHLNITFLSIFYLVHKLFV